MFQLQCTGNIIIFGRLHADKTVFFDTTVINFGRIEVDFHVFV